MTLESSPLKRCLVSGKGVYIADMEPPGTVHVVVVRSFQPFGALRGIDTSEAASMPGVLRVVT
ncbi:MAG: hypothetical protein GEV09_27580, partial [Pseudonocardiaceae bacterium]|nr:hypothetical protein [Pseudonocardiaceae bacterium]